MDTSHIYNLLRRLGISDQFLTRAYNTAVPIKNLLRYRDPFFMRGVSIETSTYCNRKCSYCPNSQFPSPENFMDENVYHKVISDLAEISFSGFVNYHFYNEPLLDERLPSWIRHAKDKLPHAFHRVYTNGDFLTVDMARTYIRAGARCFFVTNHARSSEAFDARMKVLIEAYPGFMRINPSLHDRHDTRAGLIPTGVPMRKKCVLYNNLQITFTGDVILCCNDYFRKHVFGNVTDESLLDIWKKPNYAKLRREIRRGIYRLPICRKCAGEDIK